jgi:hypothetical protein
VPRAQPRPLLALRPLLLAAAILGLGTPLLALQPALPAWTILLPAGSAVLLAGLLGVWWWRRRRKGGRGGRLPQGECAS